MLFMRAKEEFGRRGENVGGRGSGVEIFGYLVYKE